MRTVLFRGFGAAALIVAATACAPVYGSQSGVGISIGSDLGLNASSCTLLGTSRGFSTARFSRSNIFHAAAQRISARQARVKPCARQTPANTENWKRLAAGDC